MNKIDTILSTSLKPKEKLIKLSKAMLDDKALIAEAIERYQIARDPERGMWMEALELVSEQDPRLIAPHLDFVTSQLNHKAPRVRWESARLVANMAKDYPDKTSKAVPSLLKNAGDPGTVVRWSAARALVEIARNEERSQKALLPKLLALEKKEGNNGVRKIYTKFLKSNVTSE